MCSVCLDHRYPKLPHKISSHFNILFLYICRRFLFLLLLSVILVFYFLLFFKTGFLCVALVTPSWNSLCRPRWPQTYRDMSASAPQVLGSNACTNLLGLISFIPERAQWVLPDCTWVWGHPKTHGQCATICASKPRPPAAISLI